MNPTFVLFSIMHHRLTVLSEKDKDPIFVHFCAMRIAWFVRRFNYGTFPGVGKSKFVSII